MASQITTEHRKRGAENSKDAVKPIRIKCQDCGQHYTIMGKSRGSSTRCKKCREEHRRTLRSDGRTVNTSIGGAYLVTNDPDNSWGLCSSLTRTEIYDLCKMNYLAVGTKFYNKNSEREYQIERDRGKLRLIKTND